MTPTALAAVVNPRREADFGASAADDASPPEPVFIVLEFGRRTRLLRAFRDEEAAKRFARETNRENAAFANPPMVLVREIELH